MNYPPSFCRRPELGWRGKAYRDACDRIDQFLRQERERKMFRAGQRLQRWRRKAS